MLEMTTEQACELAGKLWREIVTEDEEAVRHTLIAALARAMGVVEGTSDDLATIACRVREHAGQSVSGIGEHASLTNILHAGREPSYLSMHGHIVRVVAQDEDWTLHRYAGQDARADADPGSAARIEMIDKVDALANRFREGETVSDDGRTMYCFPRWTLGTDREEKQRRDVSEIVWIELTPWGIVCPGLEIDAVGGIGLTRWNTDREAKLEARWERIRQGIKHWNTGRIHNEHSWSWYMMGRNHRGPHYHEAGETDRHGIGLGSRIGARWEQLCFEVRKRPVWEAMSLMRRRDLRTAMALGVNERRVQFAMRYPELALINMPGTREPWTETHTGWWKGVDRNTRVSELGTVRHGPASPHGTTIGTRAQRRARARAVAVLEGQRAIGRGLRHAGDHQRRLGEELRRQAPEQLKKMVQTTDGSRDVENVMEKMVMVSQAIADPGPSWKACMERGASEAKRAIPEHAMVQAQPEMLERIECCHPASIADQTKCPPTAILRPEWIVQAGITSGLMHLAGSECPTGLRDAVHSLIRWSVAPQLDPAAVWAARARHTVRAAGQEHNITRHGEQLAGALVRLWLRAVFGPGWLKDAMRPWYPKTMERAREVEPNIAWSHLVEWDGNWHFEPRLRREAALGIKGGGWFATPLVIDASEQQWMKENGIRRVIGPEALKEMKEEFGNCIGTYEGALYEGREHLVRIEHDGARACAAIGEKSRDDGTDRRLVMNTPYTLTEIEGVGRRQAGSGCRRIAEQLIARWNGRARGRGGRAAAVQERELRARAHHHDRTPRAQDAITHWEEVNSHCVPQWLHALAPGTGTIWIMEREGSPLWRRLVAAGELLGNGGLEGETAVGRYAEEIRGMFRDGPTPMTRAA